MSAERQVIRQSRATLGLHLAGCLLFVALGAWMTLDPTVAARRPYAPAVGWIAMAFFGALGGLAFVYLLKPMTLILEPAGLSWVGPIRRRSWRWRELEAFAVVRSKYSGWITVGASSAGTNSGSNPPPTTIPDHWQIDLQSLCDRLNAARDRWR